MAMRGPGPGRTDEANEANEANEAAKDEAPPLRPGVVTSPQGMRFVPGTGSNSMRWFFSAVWLVYLIAPVSGLFGHRHGMLWIAGGLAITLAFCTVYIAALVDWGGRPFLGRAGLAALAVLAALACVVYGKNWTPLWIYVSAATGVILAGEPDGRRRAVGGVLAVGACYVFFSWLSHEDTTDFLVVLLPVLLIGIAMIGFRLQIGLMHELAQARETVAKLATNEERLRLARDMHDLTGQPLPPSHARDRGRHRAERAGRGRHPARRRPRADAALGHVRRRRRGRAGLVPARGGDQRDPALRREELPDPPDRTTRRALPRGLRRRPRPQPPASKPASKPPNGPADAQGSRLARHVRTPVRRRRPPVPRRGRSHSRTRLQADRDGPGGPL